jgi:hypothetical protein
MEDRTKNTDRKQKLQISPKIFSATLLPPTASQPWQGFLHCQRFFFNIIIEKYNKNSWKRLKNALPMVKFFSKVYFCLFAVKKRAILRFPAVNF